MNFIENEIEATLHELCINYEKLSPAALNALLDVLCERYFDQSNYKLDP